MSLPQTQKAVRLMQRPVGNIIPGKDLVVFDEPVPDPSSLEEGQVLIHRLFLSLDPAMRGWMRDIRSYVPPVKVGAIMRGATVSEVVVSKSKKFKPGDIVQTKSADNAWVEYAVFPQSDVRKIEVAPGVENLPLSAYLGVLGPTGLTAYFGLLRVGMPKAGETVLVSGAAGATGSVVCQIAKILGCKVVGIAGGKVKTDWLLNELKLDGAVDYKAAKGDPQAFQLLLREALPNGVDVFFDNVGGMILNEALRRINMKARVVICGAISGYNEEDPSKVPAPTNYLSLLTMRARMEGFILFDYVREYPQALQDLSTWIAEGKMLFKEDVREGLENAPTALLSLFEGGNQGKLVVKVGEPIVNKGASSKL